MSNPKSILKRPKASIKQSISKSEAGPSSLKRNTQINSSSNVRRQVDQGRNRAGKYTKSGPDVDEGDDDEDESSDGFGEDGRDDVEMSEVDTDEEIARGKSDGKEKKGIKRKRPLTTAETFGSTLTALLSEPTQKTKKQATEKKGDEDRPLKQKSLAPKQTILALSNAKAPPSKSVENLERKAKRHVQALKEEKEDKARIRDVVEGWASSGDKSSVGGQEFEKGLRKTAQRGVIKLFNAILVASKNVEEATTSLSAKAGVKDEAKSRKEKDNIMGRGGKEKPLTQESFLDLVRKG